MKQIYNLVFVIFCICVEITNVHAIHTIQFIQETFEDSVEYLNDQAKDFKYQNPDSALIFAEKALLISVKGNYSKGMQKAYKRLGSIYYYMGRYSLAVSNLKESYIIASSFEDEAEMSSILNSIGRAYRRQGKYQEALKVFYESLSIEKRTQDDEGYAGRLNNIALVFQDMKDYTKALEYYKESLIISIDLQDSSSISLIYGNIGNVYELLGNVDDAYSHYSKALEIASLKKDMKRLGTAYRDLGSFSENLGNYREALAYFIKGLNIHQELNIQVYIGEDWLKIAKLHFHLNDLSSALNDSHKAYSISENIESIQLRGDVLKLIAKIYDHEQMIDSAYFYLKASAIVDDSLYNIEQARIVANLYSNNENDRRQFEIESLNQDKANSEAEIQQQFIRNNLLVVGVVLMVFISIFLYLQNKKRKAVNSKLNTRNKQIKKANAKLNDLNEEILKQNESINEQNVNLEKLDDIKNKLFSIISHDVRSPLKSIEGVLSLLRSDSLSREETTSLAERLTDSVSSISGFLDNLLKWTNSQMKNLSPNLEDLEIGVLIQENLNLAKLRADEKFIELQNCVSQAVLCKADKEMANLVIRNLLSNAIKFTNKNGKIRVGIDLDDNVAIIWVKDTGIGMTDKDSQQVFSVNRFTTTGTNNESGTGLGLMMCKDIVEKNGGKIWVESEIKVGSTFYFTLPMAKDLKLESIT